VNDKLAELRNQIDKIDDLVIQKMAERMQIVEKIGNYKKDNNITILQVNRWDEILNKRTSYAKALKTERRVYREIAGTDAQRIYP
jgi:chorismate mutase